MIMSQVQDWAREGEVDPASVLEDAAEMLELHERALRKPSWRRLERRPHSRNEFRRMIASAFESFYNHMEESICSIAEIKVADALEIQYVVANAELFYTAHLLREILRNLLKMWFQRTVQTLTTKCFAKSESCRDGDRETGVVRNVDSVDPRISGRSSQHWYQAYHRQEP